VTTTTEQPERGGVVLNGAEMRRRRKLGGHTVGDFAKLVGISDSYVSLIESGTRRPLPPVFARICDALEIAVDKRHELLAPVQQPAACPP
jgi:transcriptional regulator with XRE-family HTH domain